MLFQSYNSRSAKYGPESRRTLPGLNVGRLQGFDIQACVGLRCVRGTMG